MKTGTVYALSCLNGPLLYVGATYTNLEARIKSHWGDATFGQSPVHKWMRQLKEHRDLTVSVMVTVEDSEESHRRDCMLWRCEREFIKRVAVNVLETYHLLSLNVSGSPHRLHPYVYRDQFRQVRCAETVSPYFVGRHDAYSYGFIACANEESLSNNPYEFGTPNWRDWSIGYHAANKLNWN